VRTVPERSTATLAFSARMRINERMPTRRSRLVDLFLAALAIACVALAAARIAHNISLRAPLQLVTSGAEEEALFSIWSFAHGQTVYTNPLVIPYTASYFNWLFYALYASFSSVALQLLHLDDAWLPTISRLVTLSLAAMGVAVFFAALRASDRAAGWRFFALAVIALFSPLSGLWLISARPDVGAAVLELAGLALFFRYLRGGGLAWVVLTALALYGAWSFKQTSVSALGGIGLTLLILRDGRGLAVLVTLFSAGVLIALAALGSDYRHGLYLSQIHSGAHLRWGLEHFTTAAAKMPFILLALAFIPWFWWKRKRHEPWDPLELTATLTVLVAFVLEAVTSCKGGAADYYFLPLSFWSVLWLALMMKRLPSTACAASLVLVCVLMIGGIAGVFFGWRGTLDCREKGEPFEHLTRYLAARSGPVFVQSAYGDLPWISPSAPHFVVAYLYGYDRAAGVKFEHGGWENLIADGYFSTVVTDIDTTGEEQISPAMLGHYRLAREEAGFRYFERK
jgi:hypothetical protein